jgi:hypothetical protein
MEFLRKKAFVQEGSLCSWNTFFLGHNMVIFCIYNLVGFTMVQNGILVTQVGLALITKATIAS